MSEASRTAENLGSLLRSASDLVWLGFQKGRGSLSPIPVLTSVCAMLVLEGHFPFAVLRVDSPHLGEEDGAAALVLAVGSAGAVG